MGIGGSAIAALLASGGQGFLQGRQQRRKEQMDAEALQAQREQQSFQNTMAQSQLQRLIGDSDFQRQKFEQQDTERQTAEADRRATLTATATEAARKRASQKALLVKQGHDPDEADALIDAGVADDYMKPKPEPTAITPYQSASLAQGAQRLGLEQQRLEKPPVTKIESATNTSAKARLTAAISELNNADGGMTPFEQELASGKRKITAPAQLLGRVAAAFTHEGPVSQLLQSTALAALNASDPELGRYIRRGLSFAEGESMISQRPSDFRTKMSAFLSTAASGATPEMIADIQSRRRAILDPLNSINASADDGTPNAAAPTHNSAPAPQGPPAPKQAAAPPPSGVSALRQAYDAAAAHLKAQGKTDGDIQQLIGPPPP